MREQSIELTIYFSNILSWLPLGWMKDYDVWCYVGEKMHLTYYFPYHINFKFFHACLRNVKRFLLTSLFPCQQFQQNFTNAAKWKKYLYFLHCRLKPDELSTSMSTYDSKENKIMVYEISSWKIMIPMFKSITTYNQKMQFWNISKRIFKVFLDEF